MKRACSSRVAWKRGRKACTTCSTRSPGWRSPGPRRASTPCTPSASRTSAAVAAADAELLAMLRGFRWKELFWEHRRCVLRSMRISVLGHAVLEKALDPWPGITCKAIFVAPDADVDAQAAAWLAQRSTQATPRELAPVPIFGYPGWLPGTERPEFYDDTRYFRRARRDSPRAYGNAG